MYRIFVAVLVVFITTGTGVAKEGIKLKSGMWVSTLRGDIRVDSENVEGTDIDVRSVLDLGKTEDLPYFESFIPLTHTLSLHGYYWTAKYEGKETLDRQITFAGSTYNQGEEVGSRIELTTGGVLLDFLFPVHLDQMGVELEFGLQVGAKYIAFSGEVEDITLPVTFKEEERFSAPIPVAGIRGHLELLETIGIDVWATGVVAKVEATRAQHYEIMVDIQWTFFKGFFVDVGYHLFALDVEHKNDDEIYADGTIAGFFFGGGLKF